MRPTPTEDAVEATRSGWSSVRRRRRHPLGWMAPTAWMDDGRAMLVHIHTLATRGGPDLPSIRPSRWPQTPPGRRHPGPPLPPHAVPRGAGFRRMPEALPGTAWIPCSPAGPHQTGNRPCGCRTCAGLTGPGPLVPAAFLLDPGPGQGETAIAPSRGQGVEARPVKGVAEGSAAAVKLVKGEGGRVQGDGCQRSPRGGCTPPFHCDPGCGSDGRRRPPTHFLVHRPPSMGATGAPDGMEPTAWMDQDPVHRVAPTGWCGRVGDTRWRGRTLHRVGSTA